MARVTITVSDRKDGKGITVKKVVTHIDDNRKRGTSPALVAADVIMSALGCIPDTPKAGAAKES
jgi:hypothetical protein